MSEHGYEGGRLNLPFVGICTFGKYPYVENWDAINASVAVMGAPFDFGCQWRSGARMSAQSVPRDTKPVQLPVQLVVDSTGLRISGEGEWQEAKPETRRKRRSRRKLHPGLDLVSGAIVCSGLTTSDVGDPTALPEILDQGDAGSN